MLLNYYNLIVIAFIAHYFSIFYNCYVYHDFSSIGEYKVFFAQYFLLFISASIYYSYYKRYFRNNTLFSRYNLKDKFYTTTFVYQVLLTLFLILGMILSKWMYTFKEESSRDPSFTFYIASTGILVINKIVVLKNEYNLNKEFTPYGLV